LFKIAIYVNLGVFGPPGQGETQAEVLEWISLEGFGDHDGLAKPENMLTPCPGNVLSIVEGDNGPGVTACENFCPGQVAQVPMPAGLNIELITLS
jgi:hypothetical protein